MFDNISELEKEVQEFEKNILASSQLVKSIEQLANAADAQVRSFAKDSETLLRRIEQQNAAEKDALHSDVYTLLSESAKKTQDETRRVIEAAVERIQQIQNEYAGAIQKTETALKIHESELIRGFDESAQKHLTDSTRTMDTAASLLSKAQSELVETVRSAEDKLIQIQRQYVDQLEKTEKALKDHEDSVTQTIRSDADRLLAEYSKMLQSTTDALATAQQQYIAGLGELNTSLAKREDAICTKMDAILERLDKLDFEDIRKKCDGIRKSINVKFAIAMVGIVGTLAFAALSFFMK